jgi:hypothetical protein
VLDRVTVDTFAPAVGTSFVLDQDAVDRLELEKAETLTAGAAAIDDSGRRAPFRLLFRGPPDPILEQAIYRITHDRVGALEIFIVPIGRDDAGAHYEAIFT